MAKKRKPKDPAWIRFFKRINIFFQRLRRKEVLRFLVFLLISAFFWVIKTASEENDTSFNIELCVSNLPDDIVFTTQLPKQLKVSVRDKNINLLNYSYQNSIDTLEVDFARYNDALGNFRISGAELQALLLNSLFPSTQITALTPSLIDAKFAITNGKKLPVVLSADVTTAPDYRFHPTTISPDSVLIHAPSSILDTLTCVYTEHFESFGMKDSTIMTLPLMLEVGVKSTPAHVKVQIPVARFVEKTVSGVNINIIDLPTGIDLSIFPNRSDVSFLVDFSYFTDITADDFYLTVSYNSIKSSNQKYIPVELISYADSEIVSNIRLKSKEVEYIISYNE